MRRTTNHPGTSRVFEDSRKEQELIKSMTAQLLDEMRGRNKALYESLGVLTGNFQMSEKALKILMKEGG